jgi:hypothetical protein
VTRVTSVRDLLFYAHLYHGVSIDCSALITRVVGEETSLIAYRYALPAEHRLTRWLLYECGGLWRIVVPQARVRQVVLRFARAEDAAVFRLLQD